ncbi:Polygalacturonase [Thalictrum thalictroides]|uniref:Polygalacturonase n=1 Tax=Thalictrum thalictroides TaxID=46969 RepID=A0A7J6VM51_THATH|nr:Polygalacturonase [Thalictrum thalictroides]
MFYNTQAFLKAWKKACSTASATLVVPKNMNYLLKPITFSGPCKSITTLKIYGTIQASTDRSDYNKNTRHWLVFQYVQNFRVEGGGTINGNGDIWWKNSCKINTALPCKGAPTAVTFNQCDDCISIENGSQKVIAKNIRCGPGHGISIGSLGDANSNAYVSDVVVDTATLSGTTNGLRIKTWQGGSGIAKNIVFQNVVMNNVKNPIIIDQNYCDKKTKCKEQKSAVQISNVLFKNIKGTSSSNVAIKLECSKSYPCQGIKMKDINLVSASSNNGEAKASCENVKLAKSGKILPSCA